MENPGNGVSADGSWYGYRVRYLLIVIYLGKYSLTRQ